MYNRGGHWVTKMSSRGHPYYLWDWTVPRIKDDYLESVVYLYPDVPKAEAGESFGGSGFLVGLSLPGIERRCAVVVVTNQHVAAGHNGAVRVNTADSIEVFEIDDRNWLYHPDGHDIAIAPIGGLSVGRHRVKFLNPTDFLTTDMVRDFRIGPGDDCFMVGRFINHEGRQQNAPSARFGNIAQMPGDKIRFPDGSEQESFLVEARSIAGYSGSPVFLEIPFFSNIEGRNPNRRYGPWLLGIDHCHLFSREKVRDQTLRGDPVNKNWYVRSNTGMMGVVPAWRLTEMFTLPAMVSFLKWVTEAAEAELAKLADEATGERDEK
jgi:hypothetical protein